MNFDRLTSLARILMDRHGLHEWGFDFDDHVSRFGLCNHTTRTITMSYLLVALNSEETCKQVLLHEIAHALVGPAREHGFLWRMKAIEIGYWGTKFVLASLVSSFHDEIIDKVREVFASREVTTESFSMLELPHRDQWCNNETF